VEQNLTKGKKMGENFAPLFLKVDFLKVEKG
jgi:hypothetical protein